MNLTVTAESTVRVQASITTLYHYNCDQFFTVHTGNYATRSLQCRLATITLEDNATS